MGGISSVENYFGGVDDLEDLVTSFFAPGSHRDLRELTANEVSSVLHEYEPMDTMFNLKSDECVPDISTDDWNEYMTDLMD